MQLKISTQIDVYWSMYSVTDGITPVTGINVSTGFTFKIAKQGDSSFSTITPTIVEVGNGKYKATLTTTHTNTKGALVPYVTDTAGVCMPFDPTEPWQVVTDTPGDSVSSVVATVAANLTQILGTALTETAGLLAAGFKQFFNIASPTSTMNRITLTDTVTTYTGNTPQTGDNYARLGAPAGASHAADIAAVNTNVTNVGAAVTTVGTQVTAIPTNPGKILKNVAFSDLEFAMYSTSGTPVSGITPLVEISKDGGAFANSTNAVSEINSGTYKLNLTQTECNANVLLFRVSGTGALTYHFMEITSR